MMRQYHEARRACPDALLLFRMGDFYELFYDDAKTAARVLNLALTSRDKGDNPIPLAGFPHHQLDTYLGRLIAAGYRVGVCEQVEDPRQAKGLVRREVTRVVTPGTVTDESLLDPRSSNYLAAIAGDPDDRRSPLGLAWVELSTGRFVAAGFAASRLSDQLARLAPAECLLAEGAPPLAEADGGRTMVTRRPDWAFAHDAARSALAKHFGTSQLEGFGFDDSPADVQAIRAAGAVLDYLVETQKGSLDHVDRLVPYRTTGTLEIDESSRRSLELSRTIREGRREGSLLAVLDRSATAMGSRRLADWLANPLVQREPIVARHEAIAELVAAVDVAEDLRRSLRRVYDVERLLARIVTGRATPRDLSFLGRTLACLPEIKDRLSGCRSDRTRQLDGQIDLCVELRDRLAAALVDDCPLVSREGGFIRDGYRAELDELRGLSGGGKQWIAQYQAREAQRSGIPNLKVGFNKVFGYYLEVTNAHRDKVPTDYHRKQTLKNAERYITPELKEYEEKVLSAEEKAKDLEYALFVELREAAVAQRARIQATAGALAELDVLAALAELARERDYCRPEMVDQPVLEIVDGRHPVLDVTEPDGTFVPNDTSAGGESGSILLITGPNMAGKSTYIRQVALITIMAQMGSLVPARSARIGLADRIFARVGASDELARGQSTFMVEMIETARILNLATPRSLVILDEIGRGTSTYDGMSLAWAIVEHLDERLGCRTLFATHYHELTDLAQSLSRVKNLNVAVREWQDDVVFLHKIVDGAADKSYGIHVARLAGVPRDVIGRAKEILARLEEEHLDAEGRAKIARPTTRSKKTDVQLTLFGPADHPVLDELRALDLENLTPLEAMRRLEQWKQRLGMEKS
ncbi:MAG: DNA mismatch repair protein MutS [Pirellulales bacterium]|nr:DNA mismatch repair protein MutS [Pirellulales bacterium]